MAAMTKSLQALTGFRKVLLHQSKIKEFVDLVGLFQLLVSWRDGLLLKLGSFPVFQRNSSLTVLAKLKLDYLDALVENLQEL
jgi:hypothetical protein